jgi:hypothetical protein
MGALCGQNIWPRAYHLAHGCTEFKVQIPVHWEQNKLCLKLPCRRLEGSGQRWNPKSLIPPRPHSNADARSAFGSLRREREKETQIGCDMELAPANANGLKLAKTVLISHCDQIAVVQHSPCQNANCSSSDWPDALSENRRFGPGHAGHTKQRQIVKSGASARGILEKTSSAAYEETAPAHFPPYRQRFGAVNGGRAVHSSCADRGAGKNGYLGLRRHPAEADKKARENGLVAQVEKTVVAAYQSAHCAHSCARGWAIGIFGIGASRDCQSQQG